MLIRAVLLVSLVLVVIGLLGFLVDPLRLPEQLLDVLDKRASVISMGVGMLGLLLAGLTLWLQVRSPASPEAGESAGPSSSGAGDLRQRS
ncbi:hypothetical protein [Nonomuraea sp. NPDC050691]|uniref:hypothetical protein n=1 Tax=Nonomuraea sp. NPDC050691 TaxID=3155661 RepID=UPI0033EBA3FC